MKVANRPELLAGAQRHAPPGTPDLSEGHSRPQAGLMRGDPLSVVSPTSPGSQPSRMRLRLSPSYVSTDAGLVLIPGKLPSAVESSESREF